MPQKKYTLAEAGPRIEQFLQKIFGLAGFKLKYEVSEGETPHPDFENPDLLVRFSGADVDLLLANKAELLLALEQLTMEALGMPSEEHSRLCFDANDYRVLRIQELRMSALAAAERVKKARVPFHFSPMNSRERRILHLALRDQTEVRSESVGLGPIRQVVVVPADMKTLPEPIHPPRPRPEEDSRRDRGRGNHSNAAGAADRRNADLAGIATDPNPGAAVPLHLHDTIAAVSTPPGRGGIGIVRISGADARAVAEKILHFSPGSPVAWKPWSAILAELPDAEGRAVDPQVVVIYFAAPRSYTAEDVVEISCHGSPVVLRHALDRACQAGARLAEPGEFTLRAYLNGRLDLPRAEAVRDLIEATTLYQARIAAQQAEGSVSRRLKPVKEGLLELIALLEAGIDFAEDDVSVAPAEEILRRVEPILAVIAALIASFAYGKLVHDGFTLAIVGRPNVGKSSLFNRLLEQDRAIVTEIPGTTRDLVSETASIDGIPVKFVDTAGIRQGQDRIEQLGIERSFRAMADADLTLVIVDLSAPLEAQDHELIGKAREQGKYLVAGNKADLPRRAEGDLFPVSALTGEGLPGLKRRLVETIAPRGCLEQDGGFITSLRHEQFLKESREALEQAVHAVALGIPHEMLLLDLYAALRPIDAITGATTADDILNRIFSTFCIGK